jgi:hypothetical protein
MRAGFRFLVLGFSFLVVGASIVPARGRSALAFNWAPTAEQVALWTAPAPHGPEPPAPCVSLKIALPREAGITRLGLREIRWEAVPGRSCSEGGDVPVALGQRGTWHGIPYQEVLVFPLRLSKEGATEVLTHFSASLNVAGIRRSLAPAIPDGGSLPEECALFLNPSGALAFRYCAAGPGEAGSGPPAHASDAHPLRIEISRDGVYRLDYAYLTSHGLDAAGALVQNLRLTCRGLELPLLVEGPATGTLTPSHALVFYGQALDINDRPVFNGGDFTSTNIYWLSGGGAPGLRMAQVPASPSGGFPPVSQFLSDIRLEVNNYHDSLDHFRPNGDNWFWSPVLSSPAGSPFSKSFAADLPHAIGSSLTATAVLASLNSGPHELRMTLNGAAASGGPDPASWSGKTLVSQTWTFSSGVLPGTNTVTLVLPGIAGFPDFQLLDYFEFSYPRTFDAEAGGLFFSDVNANARYSCPGHASVPYILDLSASDAATGLKLPILLAGAAFSGGVATFEMPAKPSAAGRTVALSSAPLLPDGAKIADLETLPGTGSGDVADLVIITHPYFHPSGLDSVWRTYLARRQATNRVLVVDSEDIYNAYSHGLFDPTAIQSYLKAMALAGGTPPKYVLLVGDATFDYKDYTGDPANANWVPTMMFDDLGDSQWLGRFPSDSWFADVDGDGYPDSSVGRLTARSYDELAGILTKIMAYEDQSLPTDWDRGILYVADTWTQPWEQVFEETNDRLAAAYSPPPWRSTHLYFHNPPYDGTKADAFAEALRGAWPGSALIHYVGHSAISSMGNQYAIFTAYPSRNCTGGTCQDSDVDLLPPITLPPAIPLAPLPFFVSSSCYNSAFDELGSPALLEALLERPDRGTIASCGFSTIAYPDEEEAFATALFSLAFGRAKVRTVGSLVDAGRFTLASGNARSVLGNILLGDPSLSLRVAAPPAPPETWGIAAGSEAGLSWVAATPKPSSYSVYRSSDSGVTWARLNARPVLGTSFLDPGLAPGATYSYYVTSVDPAGLEGPPSQVVTFVGEVPPPAGPTLGPRGIYPQGSGSKGS